MRSFPILLTAAAFGVASANPPSDDVVVTVTSTRTHTFCPVTQPVTCPADPTGTNVSPATGAGWGNGGQGAPGQNDNVGDVWASLWDNAKTEYHGQWDDWNNVVPTSTSSTSATAAPTTTGSHSNGGFSTTGYWNGTTTGSATYSTGTWSATTSSSSAGPTLIKNETDVCNDNLHRSKWCDNKSIDSDYYKNDYHTGVTRKYLFTITNTTLVFDGTGPKLALAINGQVPGPVIEANWGDDIEVTFVNKMQDNSTSIHFHGIRQEGTNDQDGVPGITECGIAGNGGSRTYKFHASSFGTSWYHSHMFTQLGDGIRGPIVIHGPATADYDYDMGTLMLDDTFTISAAAQAARIAHFGPGGTFNTLFNGKNKSPDGKVGESFGWSVKPGKKHLFRIINSAAQNSFIVGFDKHTLTVIAADFIPIKPYKTDTVKIANGQRYDVILEADQAVDKYYVRAVLQTACPSGGANSGLGVANAVITYEGANSTAVPLSQTAITNVTAAICQDEPLASLVPYNTKRAGTLSQFQGSSSTIPGGALTSVATNDDGTVFQWFLNNAVINVDFHNPTLQTLASGTNNTISNPITLNKANEWVYFVIQNQFFVSHPMHIHGHDVSILGQGQGNFGTAQAQTLNFANPMRRDTVMLQGGAGPGQPTGYTVIGFETDNPGAWLMHCHIAWHLDGGLALQFIERPSDITASAYVGKQSFKDECSALTAYEAANPQGAKTSGQSGLKRRYEAFDIEPFHAGAKMHIDKYRKRYAAHGHRH